MRNLPKLLVILFLFLLAPGAHAATITWDGGGGDPFWSTAANWAGDAIPLTGDDLLFPAGAAQLTNNNDLADTFNSITIEASGYLLQGAEITLSNGITTTYASGTSRIHSQINALASQFFTVAAGGTLRISTGITLNGILTLGGDGNYLFDGVVSGPGRVTVNGGVVTFDNLNTFGNFLQINDGTVGGSGAVPNVVQNGGTLTAGNLTDPTFTTGDVGTSGGTVQLSMLSPTIVQQLDVNGTISISNTSLVFGFSPANAPAPGAVLTLILNDGADATGAFNGLPEGATFTVNGRTFRISYVGGDGNDVTLIATAADLSVTKVVDDPTPDVGQNVTFTISVANAGSTSATDVVVTDTLPAGLTFVSANTTQGSCSGTAPVTCTLGTMNSGGTATITLVATVASAGTHVNSVTVTGDDFDPAPGNNTSTSTVTATAAAAPTPIPTLDPRALAALAVLIVIAAAFVLRS